MTFQKISAMAPFETYDAPETGHTVKGNFEFLDNFKRETLKHPSPPGNVRERFGAIRHLSGTPLAHRLNFQSFITEDNISCPVFVFDIPNQMTSETRSASQTLMMEAKPAASFKNKFDESIVSANVERHFENCATLRSDSNNSKTALTKLTKIVKHKFSTHVIFKMKAFLKRKYFATIAKKKAGANVFKSSEDHIIPLGTTAIDMKEATNNVNCLTNTSEIQNLIDHMSQESCEIHVINNIRNPNVPDTTHTTGLILEVSVAITVSSDVNNKPILLNKVLIDTGCTSTIIKRNSLPDQF